MKTLSFCMLGLGALLLLGCNDPKTEETKTEKSAEAHDESAHEHPSKGPHNGPIIELGDEEYHGEWVVDKEKNTVTVYILDSAAKETVPIEAAEIHVSAKSVDYALAAEPQAGEPPGQSSRFVITSEPLVKYLGGNHVHARLILKIAGKSYSPEFESHGE